MKRAIPMWDNPDRRLPLGKPEVPPLSEEEQEWLRSKNEEYKRGHWFMRAVKFVWAMFW